MDVRRGEGHLTTEAGQAVAILGAQRLVLSDLALSILESVPAQGTTSLSELATSVEAEFGAPEPPHTSQALTEAHVHDLAAHGLLVIDGGQAPGSSAGSSASAVAAVRNAVAAVMAGSPGWSLPTDVSAGSFVAAAERHRVVPQLSRQVALLDLPLAARAGLAARTAHLTRSNEDALRDLRDALQVLRAADIRVLVVKGVALAAQAWGDESARGYGDLDLLVPPAELGRTHALLAETGWRASRGFPVPGPTWAWRQHERSDNEVPLQRGETMIDLHWHLGPSRSLHPGFDELWTRRSSVLVSGTEVATLGLYDALAHSAGHTAKDHWEHLRGLADVWQLLRRPETWAQVPYPLRHDQRLSIGLAARMFGVPPGSPEVVHASAAASSSVMDVALRRQAGVERAAAREAGHLSGFTASLGMLRRSRADISDYLRQVSRSAFPPWMLADEPAPHWYVGAPRILRRRGRDVVSRFSRHQ